MAVGDPVYPWFETEDGLTIYLGDCCEVMAGMEENSVDAIVTDPPYLLNFMGKQWDRTGSDLPTREIGQPAYLFHYHWALEALRVAKPGAHLVAFGGTRTWHRLACAIEDAGWEIRDTVEYLHKCDCGCHAPVLSWNYGSGFPKSLSPYRSIMGKLCRYHDAAPHAVQVSPWLPHAFPEGKEPIALALAEILPEGDLVLLMATGKGDDSGVPMAISLSGLTGATNSNTVSSCLDYSVDRWPAMSMSIIETAIREITLQRIWSYSESQTIAGDMLQVDSLPNGCKCVALPVASRSIDGSVSWKGILWPIAHEPVIGLLSPLRGIGTSLKPAWEPILLARKPLDGNVAQNVLKWGVGGLNIDGTRIGDHKIPRPTSSRIQSTVYGRWPGVGEPDPNLGRWPANLVLDEEAAELLDAQIGTTSSTGRRTENSRNATVSRTVWGTNNHRSTEYPGDSGGPSRFFYVAKASRAERERGLEHLTGYTPGQLTDRQDGNPGTAHPRAGAGRSTTKALRLRADLSDEDRAFVIQELRRAGVTVD